MSYVISIYYYFIERKLQQKNLIFNNISTLIKFDFGIFTNIVQVVGKYINDIILLLYLTFML